MSAGVAIGRRDDGLVDAVGGIVGELDQQQAVAGRCCPCSVTHSSSQRLAMPAVGETARLVVAVVVAEVFFQRQLGEQEGDLVGPAALEVVEGVDARFADDRSVLGPGGDVGGGEGELSSPR